MELKVGYKQTEIGALPSDWEVRTLGEIAEVKTGPFGSSLHQSDYVIDGTPIITVEHLGERGVVHENLPMVSDTDKKRLSAYSLQTGDIVFSRVGSVDRNSLVRVTENGWLFSGRLLRIRVDKKITSPEYLSYHFHQEPTKQRIRCVSVGQTMASLNTQILKDIVVSLPPTKAEQTAIATALSDIDTLITSLDQLIAKKRDIKQATMQQLLNGKKRLAGFSGKWEVKRLGNLCEKITTGKLDANAMVVDGDYPFFTCARERYWIDEYVFDTEALLVSGNGANVGYIHYYNGKFNAYQRTYVLNGFKSNVHFLKLFMERNLSDRLRTEVNAGNTPYIVMGTLTDMQVTLPVDQNEQAAIANILLDMDADITELETKRDKTIALRQGMMQELLTGRIRLI